MNIKSAIQKAFELGYSGSIDYDDLVKFSEGRATLELLFKDFVNDSGTLLSKTDLKAIQDVLEGNTRV